MNNLDTFMRVGFVEEKGEGGGRHKDNSRELSETKQSNQIKNSVCVLIIIIICFSILVLF